jgi:hypothetical protein
VAFEEEEPLLLHQKSPKIFSSDTDELVAPLLSSEERPAEEAAATEHSAITAVLRAASSLAMDTPPTLENSSSNSNLENDSMTNRIFTKLVSMKTLADTLPPFLQFVLTNGKISSLCFIGIYFVIVLIWLPFRLLAYFITELGVYAFLILTVFFLGRCIIRLLAFPGSSSRVPAEIETEFARYSVRMVQSSASCVVDLCQAILASTGGGGAAGYYDVPGLWARTKSYRDRVLGMYLDVLMYLFREPDSSGSTGDTTKYGNNKISGDIGDLSGLTEQARLDGRALMELLKKVLHGLHQLEQEALPVLTSATRPTSPRSLSEEARKTVKDLLTVATELKDVVTSFKPQSGNMDMEGGDLDDDDEGVSVEAMRARLESETETAMDTVKGTLDAIGPLLDPPPHSSIFGLDVLRGTVLSRYKGSKQLWIPRPSGGRLDAIYIPAPNVPANGKRKAVLYCNPNAGLIEVATGMSLSGGNVVPSGTKSHPSWADYYTENGYDVFLFNYAGFGRSDGRHFCAIGNPTRARGFIGAIRRIFHFIFLTFKPTPQSLRDDGTAVGKHIVSDSGYSSLVIHGESIGGLASSGAARALSHSPTTRDVLSLLICDRTFCNLEATAQRLVGSWTGPAIFALAPFWNLDVTGDFLSANCRKIVANDSADAIIADASSLKAGVSLSREICRGESTAKLGWMTEAPLTYRMADWENVGVNDSSYVKSPYASMSPPVWPKDKHITSGEAFHFAACVRRIGKVATAEKRAAKSENASDEEQGFESNGLEVQQSEVASNGGGVSAVWKVLACCDGLCGTPLGFPVKDSFDSTVTWLCCTLTLGGQRVAAAADRRMEGSDQQRNVIASDFDSRHPGFQEEESDIMIHPKPIPEVLEALKQSMASNNVSIKSVEHEIRYTTGMLQYIVARLSSAPSVESNTKSMDLQDTLGAFLDLNCGHNNPFSDDEKRQLTGLLIKATYETSNN